MSADEMFRKLGYDFTYSMKPDKDNKLTVDTIVYYKKIRHIIHTEVVSIILNNFDKKIVIDSSSKEVTMQELKAINKKVEELGWNES